jgi:hypothetical protein
MFFEKLNSVDKDIPRLLCNLKGHYCIALTRAHDYILP